MEDVRVETMETLDEFPFLAEVRERRILLGACRGPIGITHGG
jgi:hypothetical protein